MIDPLLDTVFACCLAALFASTAAHKVREGLRFQAQLSEYRLVPEATIAPAAYLLTVVEACLALALLVPVARGVAALFAGALIAGYTAAIGINLLRGRDHIDCGCGDAPTLLSPWLLLRNAALVAIAAVVTLPEVPRALGALDLLFGVLAFLSLALLWVIVELLLANASALREWSEARD